MDNDAQIYNVSQACNHLFAKILNKRGTACAFVAEVLHLRFNQWTSYLGVFAQENMSLDTRLQYSQSISQLVLQFLKIVSRNLEHVDTLCEALAQTSLMGDDLQQSIAEEVERTPESGASSPLAESLRAIKLAIDGLYRLGAAIRQSSSSALTQRIGRFIKENDDLAIENLVFLRLKHKFFDSSENGNNCRSPLSLYKQLATSISFRYYGIRYRQERQDTIEKRREDSPVWRRTSEMTDAPKEKDKSGQNELKKLAIANARIPKKPKKEEPPTTIHSKDILAKYTEKPFAQPNSVLSSYMEDTKYPDAPKVDPRTREARCPFCSRPILEMDLKKKDWWHRHLNQDLKLYTCLSERCTEPPQFFIRFQEWKQHMDENHTTNWIREIHKPHGWCCDVDHDDLYFEDEVEYDQHVQEIHPQSEAEKSELKEWGELQRERPQYTCPICNRVPRELATIYPWLEDGKLSKPEATNIDTMFHGREENAQNKLLLHIGTHLKQLGLMSVAYLEDEAEEEKIGSKRNSIPTDEYGNILFTEDHPSYLDPQFDGYIQRDESSAIEGTVDWSYVIESMKMEKGFTTNADADPILKNFKKHREKNFKTAPSGSRPQLWQCCKCSGGWYNYDFVTSCPMCHAWRCDNCRYSIS
ncbi:uncharacterized protein TrAtP1_009526 [Trichoderma atroviride]|uniref:uncharacterized protein n=1 Tax=Hypocrea atroviridis TaxID=63577 RepID=UPI003316A84D|nr:hypothetical protein TrAtP1_009526 [Trichoderma atroviride]